MSITAALEEVSFGPCYQMTEIFDKPDHVAFWDDAVDAVERGEAVDWERVFSGYEAPLDWPAACSTRS